MHSCEYQADVDQIRTYVGWYVHRYTYVRNSISSKMRTYTYIRIAYVHTYVRTKVRMYLRAVLASHSSHTTTLGMYVLLRMALILTIF